MVIGPQVDMKGYYQKGDLIRQLKPDFEYDEPEELVLLSKDNQGTRSREYWMVRCIKGFDANHSFLLILDRADDRYRFTDTRWA